LSVSVLLLQIYNGVIGYIPANNELFAVERIKGVLYVFLGTELKSEFVLCY